MSRNLYFVGIAHNTAELPYKIASEIAHDAQTKGLFDKVVVLSFYQSAHATLLPLVGQTGGQFTPAVLSMQMPWFKPHQSDPEKEKKLDEKGRASLEKKARQHAVRFKYATSFIEAIEAMNISVHKHFYLHAFRVEVLRRMQELPEGSKILFVVTDVRNADDYEFVTTKCGARALLMVRILCQRNREHIKCDELDGSFWEQYAEKANKEQFHVDFDDNYTEQQLESLLQSVAQLKVHS